MNKKILSLGEILLRFQAEDHLKILQNPKYRVYVGGSEANVTVALAQLNWSAQLLSALPTNDLAEQALQYFRSFSVQTDHVYALGERIGTYFMEAGASKRGSKIVYDRKGASINDLKVDDVNWESAFAGVTHFHWSAITPSLSANAAEICRHAIEIAQEKKCHISTDLHFRKNLWQFTDQIKDIMLPMIKASHTVNGDPFTWERITAIKFGTDQLETQAEPQDFEPVFRRIKREFPSIENLSMLVRKVHHANHHELSGLLLSQDDFKISKNHSVNPIVDRVGGGDAFVAGLLYGLHTYDSAEMTIDFATTLSSLKHTIPGDAFIGTLQDVTEAMNQSVPGKINR